MTHQEMAEQRRLAANAKRLAWLTPEKLLELKAEAELNCREIDAQKRRDAAMGGAERRIVHADDAARYRAIEAEEKLRKESRDMERRMAYGDVEATR